MRSSFKRALSGVAALGLSAALAPFLAAPAASAAPGPQPVPPITPSPVASPGSTFSFDVASLGGARCDGTGGEGWRVQTFIVEEGVDISTRLFNQGFPPNQIGDDRDASDGTIASPLFKGGSPGTGYNPAASPAGLINPSDLAGFSFSDAGWVLVDGVYQIGFACVNPTGPDDTPSTGDEGVPSQWWVNTVTIDADGSPNPFMVEGTPAAAPTIDAVNVDNGQIIIDFTGTGGDSYIAQATTVSGDYSSPVGTSTTAADDTSALTISGLSNGTSYFVRVLAQKPGFADTPSAESGPHVPQTNCGAVQALTVTESGTDDGAGDAYVDVDWNAPAAVGGCPAPTGYAVSVNTSGTPTQPDPTPTGTGAESARISGVPTNTPITVTVTPTFGAGFVGTAANTPAFVATGNIVIQDIDVTRPIGALVLTQVCGTNGTLPAEGADATAADFGTDGSDTPGTPASYDLNTAPLGFDRPGALPEVPGVNSSSVGTPTLGAAPKLTPDPLGGTPTDQPAADDDPAYLGGEYPYPTDGNGVANPAAETHCGLDLGVAEFVTQGSGAGQYFAAEAAMNQITIVDTRNVDQGWTVSGSMSDFVASSEAGEGAGTGADLDAFSGDFLGWTPVVTEDTSAFDHDADPATAPYNQQVVAGAPVEPGTDLGLGDGSSEVLASAASGQGLGTAILDARVKLLIPVNADAGLYEGFLTFSAV